MISGEEKNKEKGDRDSLRETKKKAVLGRSLSEREKNWAAGGL